jgi:hypothetical protein
MTAAVACPDSKRFCKVCRADISDRRPHALCCSARCRGIAFRGGVYLPSEPCKGCGERLPEGSRGDRRWCSEACRQQTERATDSAAAAAPRASGCVCGGATYLDEDDDRRCLSCGRVAAG